MTYFGKFREAIKLKNESTANVLVLSFFGIVAQSCAYFTVGKEDKLFVSLSSGSAFKYSVSFR